jgi:hypothetical protein
MDSIRGTREAVLIEDSGRAVVFSANILRIAAQIA